MKKILIIDDNLYTNKEAISKVKDCRDYITQTTDRLWQAEELLKGYVFDVIVIDIMMPCDNLKNKDELKAGLNFYEEKVKHIEGIENAKILFWSHLCSDVIDEFFGENKPDNVYFLHKDRDNESHLLNMINELIEGKHEPKEPSFTREELGEFMTQMGYEDSIVFEDPSYLGAVIGYSDTGQVCYDYDKMIEWLMEQDGMSAEDAIDFISYNTERALPYCSPSEKRPIIIYPLPII